MPKSSLLRALAAATAGSLLAGSLLIVGLGLAQPAAAQQSPHAARSKLEALKDEIGKLKETLEHFRDERSRVRNNLRQSELEINATQKKIRAIEQQIEQQQQELKKLDDQRRTLKQAQHDQQQQIGRQIRAAWQLGRQNRLKALLNQEDPDKVSRALTYYDYFNRARSEQIEAYLNIISQLDAMQPQIEQKTAALQDARAELDKQRSAQLDARRERKQALTKLARTIQTKDEKLRQMADNREALERLLKRLERLARHRGRNSFARTEPSGPGAALPQQTSTRLAPAGHSFAQLRGELPWPVAGRPINRFGAQRGDTSLRWQGINIVAPEGTTVQAVYAGRVIFANWLRGSGLLLIIDHGGGFMSLYAHNQTLLRSAGDEVKAGDPIATVGNSGGQEQAALYFEIRREGVPTDPARWCRR